MSSFETDLLCILLNCGSSDICMLEDTDKDLIADVVQGIQENGIGMSLNTILSCVFNRVESILTYYIEDDFSEIDRLYKEFIADCEIEETDCGCVLIPPRDEDLKELHELYIEIKQHSKTGINPIEDDFSYYTNCQNSSMHLKRLGSYKILLPNVIEDVEEASGFEFSE